MADLTPVTSDMAALTAPSVTATETASTPTDDINKKIAKSLKSRADDSVTHKKKYLNDWKRNVDTILGQPVPLFTEGLDINADLQSAINPDWSLTKTKTANLFSAVPTIRGTHENQKYALAVSPFLKQLNYELGPKRANIAVAMRECLTDVVNASGIAAAFVSYSARFDNVEVPAEDTLLPAPPPAPVAPQMGPDGQPMPPAAPAPAPQAAAARPVSDMFSITRISPRDLLWASEFVSSDFNTSDFIGHRGKCPKAVGKVEFKLTDDELKKATEQTPFDGSMDLKQTQHTQPLPDVDEIAYTELFYWRYRQDPDEKNFKAIWRIVYVDGIDEPKIHEPWKGQRLDPQSRTYVGACKFPIQVLTLMYVTDNPVPPSDSQAGRPQVADMRRSRSQMFQNRQRSIPIRWFDVNRIDQDLQANLMRGIVQGMIPTNGAGDRAIGEIARASYPSENIEFDQAAKADLMESWQVGPNQTGAQGQSRTTAGEANIVQQNFTTRIGQERAFVASFVLALAEVLAGLMTLYSDFPVLTDQEKQALQQNWDYQHITHDLVLNIVPDSTIMLDSNQRIDKLMKVLNMTVQSGFVNPESIIAEILELSGLDPAAVMTKPPDKKDPPQLSYRFSGKDDMQNPIVLGLYLAGQDGQPISPEYVKKAAALLDAAIMPTPPPGMPGPGGPGGPPAGPGGPGGPPAPPNGQQPPAHPDWHQAPKVASRSRELTGGGS